MEENLRIGVSPIESRVTEYGDVGRRIIPKKEKDTKIAELEQQLAIAENRCTTLRKQVEYMRLLYDGVDKPLEREGSNYKIDEKRQDLQFFPERQRNKDTLVPEPSVFHEKFLTDFNEGFVSEITGSRQHVGKDPKDVVQIILSGMTKSINDISAADVNFKTNKPNGGIKKLKETENEKLRQNKSKVEKTQTKKPGKHDSSKATSSSSMKSPKVNARQKKPKQLKTAKVTKKAEVRTVPPVQLKSPQPQLIRRQSRTCQQINSRYQLPTVSYRMKCVPKSHTHFNIKSIPFVVGMSTNKSHNLGMKVQETLSLIKLNNHSAISQTALADPDSELGSLLQYVPPQAASFKNNTRSRYLVGRGSLGNMKRPGSFLQAKPSSVSVGTTVDYKNYQLRNVLINLHDEFSKMTMRYDELKEEAKTKKDPKLDEELQKLEESLTAKENEINAIMGLYNEVTDLKDKLNYMERRTSSMSLFARNDSAGKPTTSNGLKMARLLRKIEEFQDNLKGNTFM